MSTWPLKDPMSVVPRTVRESWGEPFEGGSPFASVGKSWSWQARSIAPASRVRAARVTFPPPECGLSGHLFGHIRCVGANRRCWYLATRQIRFRGDMAHAEWRMPYWGKLATLAHSRLQPTFSDN